MLWGKSTLGRHDHAAAGQRQLPQTARRSPRARSRSRRRAGTAPDGVVPDAADTRARVACLPDQRPRRPRPSTARQAPAEGRAQRVRPRGQLPPSGRPLASLGRPPTDQEACGLRNQPRSRDGTLCRRHRTRSGLAVLRPSSERSTTCVDTVRRERGAGGSADADVASANRAIQHSRVWQAQRFALVRSERCEPPVETLHPRESGSWDHVPGGDHDSYGRSCFLIPVAAAASRSSSPGREPTRNRLLTPFVVSVRTVRRWRPSLTWGSRFGRAQPARTNHSKSYGPIAGTSVPRRRPAGWTTPRFLRRPR